MTSAPTLVRLATEADVDAVVATVSAAFVTDPAWSFITGSRNVRAREAFARTLLMPRLRRGTAWVSDDCTAVAMWDRLAIDRSVDDGHEARWSAFRAEVGEGVWSRLQDYEAALKESPPARPYWYLGVLATHPDHQGRGLASAVLRPGLVTAEDEGWDCWLETSTPGNKTFYAGRGFTESVPVDVPGGPATWWLRRPAAVA